MDISSKTKKIKMESSSEPEEVYIIRKFFKNNMIKILHRN